MKYLLYTIFFALFFFSSCKTVEVAIYTEEAGTFLELEHQPADLSEREALIILPGFSDTKRGRRHQRKYFSGRGYDLFIPDYIDRKTFQGSMDKFSRFMEKNRISEYKKVHFLPYIFGTWLLNTYLQDQPLDNLASLIYDRSPYQERADVVAMENIRWIATGIYGPVLYEFSQLDYPAFVSDSVKIGIIVETKPSLFIRLYKREAMSHGPLDWTADSFKQDHDDLIYIHLNHAEMYRSFEVTGPDILHFLQNGRFTEKAKRQVSFPR